MIILNPKHLCSSMASTVKINQSKKEITRCVRQTGIKYTVDDLKIAKGDIFLNQTLHKEFMKMKSNEMSKYCFGCNFSYQDSVNRWKNKTWDAKEFETLELKKQVVTWCDFILSPICNMACTYCDSSYSSTWKALNGEPNYIVDQEWNNAALDSLIDFIKRYVLDVSKSFTVNILGGEPMFLWKDSKHIVSSLAKVFEDSKSQLIISIATNLNVSDKFIQEYIDLVRSYPDIEFQVKASLDALGERAENIRTGLDYDLFLKNINIIASSKLVHISINQTVNVFSINGIENFYRYWIDWANTYDLIKTRNFWITHNICTFPVYMDPAILPTRYRLHIEDLIGYLDTIQDKRVNDIKIFWYNIHKSIGTKRTDQILEKAKNFFIEQGKKKDIDYFILFPELAGITNASM